MKLPMPPPPPVDSHKGGNLATAEDVAAIYPKEPARNVITGMHNKGRRMPSQPRTYQIYTINSLPLLIHRLKTNPTAYENPHAIRYLLTPEGELLFAEEGNEPAHFVMTGETEKSSNASCACAGNLFFNDDYTQFTLVNNKSSDFLPENALLKKVLGVLVALAEQSLISLQDSFQIQHQRQSTNEIYTTSFNVLKQYIHQAFSDSELNQFVSVNKAAQHREVPYNPKHEVPGIPSTPRKQASSQVFHRPALTLSPGLFSADAHTPTPIAANPDQEEREQAVDEAYLEYLELDGSKTMKRPHPDSDEEIGYNERQHKCSFTGDFLATRKEQFVDPDEIAFDLSP